MKFYSARLFLLGILAVTAGCKDDVAENDPPSASAYLFTFNERQIGTPSNSTALFPDGDLVICGQDMQIPYNQGDVYRVDQNGNQIWRTNPSPNGLITDIMGVVAHPNGDIYICGSAVAVGSPTGSDAFIARLNADGDTVWTQTWADSGSQKVSCIAVAGDGGLLFTVSDYVAWNSYEITLVKTSASGSVLWMKPFLLNYSAMISHLSVCANEDLLITGLVSPLSGIYSPALVRTDMNGNVVWTQYLDISNPVGSNFGPSSVLELMNGDIMISGTGQFYPYSYLTYARLNPAGDTLWTDFIRDSSATAVMNCVLEVDADAIVLGGGISGTLWDDSDNYIRKINSIGEVIWEKQFGSSEDNCIMNLSLDGDKILITGQSGFNVFLARSGTDGVLK